MVGRARHQTRTNSTFAYLPKLGRGFQGQGYAFLALTHAMLAGDMKGLFCFGQNPAVGGANARLIRAGLDKLEWMVVADFSSMRPQASGSGPAPIRRGSPQKCFVLPASFRRRERRQHRQQRALGAVAPPRDQADRRLPPRPRYRRRTGKGIKARLRKRRSISGADPPSRMGLWRTSRNLHRVARELNGRFLNVDGKRWQDFAAGKQVPGFAQLRDDGTHHVRQLDLLRQLHRSRATWPRGAT